eukprot:gnl/Trimastix_PCT/2197.p1 GENE.gnl/Trimastix_PCT/2197~~gnl/Trimastix_PCT/2197.p1  ORF type:complete len:261 (+),score=21.14 gnl/Trimastix_PCT/2197:19-801(+)
MFPENRFSAMQLVFIFALLISSTVANVPAGYSFTNQSFSHQFNAEASLLICPCPCFDGNTCPKDKCTMIPDNGQCCGFDGKTYHFCPPLDSSKANHYMCATAKECTYIQEPNQNSFWPPGTNQTIIWKSKNSGEGTAIINLQCKEGATVIASSTPNSGSFIWFIPKSTKPERCVLLVHTDFDGDARSAEFTLGTAGFPVFFFLLPFMIFGIAAVILIIVCLQLKRVHAKRLQAATETTEQLPPVMAPPLLQSEGSYGQVQ